MTRVYVDKEEYDLLVQVLKNAGKNTKTGLKRIVNQTAREAKKDLHNKVFDEYVVKKKYFGSDHIKLTSATNTSLKAGLLTSGRPIHLREFRSRKQTKKEAAKAFVKQENSYKALETKGIKAFVRKLSNGKIVILRRKTKKRYPLEALHGPGRAQMADKAYRKIEREVQNKLNININLMIGQVLGEKK